MIKYLEVIKTGSSIELDTDINYHHDFSIGELLVIDIITTPPTVNLKRTIYNDVSFQLDFNLLQNKFKINWDSRDCERLNIVSMIESGYLIDVTECINRNKKLELLGI